jgi:PAS domain S-box-containing protein
LACGSEVKQAMNQKAERAFRDPARLEEIISSLSEGVIVLDESGSLVWANDAALGQHGLASLKGLGAHYKDYAARFELRYRNNHRLDENAYPMARAVAGEMFQDVVVEVRKADEDEALWVHSVRSFHADDPSDGKIAFLIINDLTEQYQAEQRFEAAFNANPAPAIICRLSDLRYVKVNPGFLEMTGYTREDLVGHSAYEIDVLSQASKRELAMERLKENRTIPQMEAAVPLPDGKKKFVIVAGEPMQYSDEACMLFTFADLDPLKGTEHALRQSEERFSKSFQLSPAPQAITTLKDFKVTEINQAFRDLFGYAEDEIIGHKATDFILWDDKMAQHQIEGAFEKTGIIDKIDLKIQTKNEVAADCLVSAATVTIGDELCVLWVIQDIADRKRSEDELVAAIEAVMEDTSWFSRTVVEKLAGLRRATKPSSQPSIELDELTNRERDILGLICQGQSDEDMSKSLGLSPNTIRNHVSSLFRKIGVRRRAAAIIWARERGVSGRDAGIRLKAKRPKARKPAQK